MNSTGNPSELTHSIVVASADPEPEQAVGSPASDSSSFSDAYKEQPMDGEKVKEQSVDQSGEVSDDYAMTFDSDGEEVADSRDLAATVEQPMVSLPATIPVNDSTPSISIQPTTNDVPQNGQNANANQTNPSFPASIDAHPIQSTNTAASAPIISEPSPSHQYENIANGGVDIQQLLDNITANAERNEAAATAHSPSSQNANSSYPKPAVALPAHSSLPPRPIAQNYAQNEDMQKYHAGPPGVPSSSSYRAPGGAPPSISTGPPGVYPSVISSSFRQPAQSSASPNSPSFNQFGPPGQGQVSADQQEEDDVDKRWGPEVQRKYDAFLEQERKYVTEGLWDRFPNGSRLFIGKK
jgi:nuclear polyadenylated RNA-binding protein 3